MSGAILRCENLSRRFGGLMAVDDVSLEIERAEVHCIIGPNGAGKSTLLNMVCGTVEPSSGRIFFEDRSLVGRSKHEIARMGIARKFQVPSVFGSMTVRENLAVARAGRAAADEVESEIEETLELIELAGSPDTLAAELAHGQKQWLEIGMALMLRPKLLLLDEPTAGMTNEETSRTARLLLSLKARHTVLVIEHDMRFVRELASRTIVMHQGRVIAAGSFEEIEGDEMVRDIYLGRH